MIYYIVVVALYNIFFDGYFRQNVKRIIIYQFNANTDSIRQNKDTEFNLARRQILRRATVTVSDTAAANKSSLTWLSR